MTTMSILSVSVSGFHNHHFASSNLNAATISSWKPVVAILNNKNKMRVPFELKQGQSRIFHELPSGLSMEGWCASATWGGTVTTDDMKSDGDLDCETGDERGREFQCDTTVREMRETELQEEREKEREI
ncbi:Alpha/beta-Hydrolases superfamily protein [Arachis hypogaea]|nr:Alpha/beta-Hydrolases superfamily protein [Arachis hypogaea]